MNAPQFKITKRVTMAVLSIKPNQGDRFFKFVAPMYVGKKLDDQKNAATLLESIDLVTGEHGVIIVPTILQNDLNENYPGNAYVGKCFAVTVTRNAAKKYNHVSLAEVEAPTEAPAAPATPKAGEGGDSPEGGDTADAEAVEGYVGEEAVSTEDVSTAATPIQAAGGKRRR